MCKRLSVLNENNHKLHDHIRERLQWRQNCRLFGLCSNSFQWLFELSHQFGNYNARKRFSVQIQKMPIILNSNFALFFFVEAIKYINDIDYYINFIFYKTKVPTSFSMISSVAQMSNRSLLNFYHHHAHYFIYNKQISFALVIQQSIVIIKYVFL